MYVVPAPAVFEYASHQAVWGKLTVGPRGLRAAAVRLLALAGPVAAPAQVDSFYRELRVVAADGTAL